jgi:endonuclease/exonuclease/phosphatase family metal-dependent hydrolase
MVQGTDTEAGYSVVSTVDLVARPYPPPPYPSPPFPRWPEGGEDHIQRKNFNLVAARHPIAALPGLSFPNPEEARFAFAEKYLASQVTVEGVETDIHNAHLPPGSSRGVIKVYAFEAIRRRVDQDSGSARILCGDFNAPVSEDADGPLLVASGEWPEEIQSRWDEAETSVVKNPDLPDVYREVYPEATTFPASHYTGRGARRSPRRYDHIFASCELKAEKCAYLGEWLEGRLSDHAPVEAELVLVC